MEYVIHKNLEDWKSISSLITLSSFAGEYSADNAWDFKELEDAINKSYF